jgi:hypothetical protein
MAMNYGSVPVAAGRRLTGAMAATAVLALAACSADAAPGGSPTAPAAASPATTSAPASSTGEPLGGTPLPEDGVSLEPGTWISRLGFPYPDILLDIPKGWESMGTAWISNGEEFPQGIGLTVWVVLAVYAHPCQWDQPLITPGPSAADLAEVLAARPLRDATQPEDVELGGHPGKFLRWSVPDDIDFATCDVDPADGEHYFESWRAMAGGSDRYQQGAGQYDELWIIDAGRHRIVFDATYFPDGVDPDQLAEIRAIVESARFVEKGA